MRSIPLRHALRYDPVFLELGRRLALGEFGPPTGIGSTSVLGSEGDVAELIAFWFLFFGAPIFSTLRRDPASSLHRAILGYPLFGLSVDMVVVDAAALPYGPTLTGSVSCTGGFIEFRYGAERLLSYARQEDSHFPIALPEGDGAFYRAADLEAPADGRLLSDYADEAAVAFARDLIARGS